MSITHEGCQALRDAHPVVAFLCPLALCSVWLLVPRQANLGLPLGAAWACSRLVPRCSGGMFLRHLPSVMQPRLCCARLGQAGRTHGSASQEHSLGKAFHDSTLPATGGDGRALAGLSLNRQCWWLPSASLSHSCPWGLLTPCPSYTVSITPPAPPPCCHRSQGWKSWGAACCGVSWERAAPAAQERPLHITGNRTAACKLIIPKPAQRFLLCARVTGTDNTLVLLLAVIGRY